MGALRSDHTRLLAGAVLLSIVLLVAAPLWAADELPMSDVPMPAASSVPAAPEEPEAAAPPAPVGYLVRIGDQLRVSVWGEQGLTGEASVMPDGTVSLPMIGSLQVLGETVPAITRDVTQAYRRYLKDPKVSLSCVPKSPMQVYFGGAVARPGPVDYDPRLRLFDYLALAGGPAVGADLTRVIVTSVSGGQTTTTTLDLGAAKPGEDVSRNPVLKPGDTVWIGQALPVSVVGAVAHPGSFDYQQGLRLSDYLGMAGGPTEQANTKAAVLKRMGQQQVVPVNVAMALEKPDSAERNPAVAPGDVLTVPAKFVGGTLSWAEVLQSVTSAALFWLRWK
jgi:polysaccharide biosynthesis/export protein